VRHCGCHDRLLLSKGKQDGMPFSLFVILLDLDKETVSSKVPNTSSSKMRYRVLNVVFLVGFYSLTQSFSSFFRSSSFVVHLP
jgi:hypothetical protein